MPAHFAVIAELRWPKVPRLAPVWPQALGRVLLQKTIDLLSADPLAPQAAGLASPVPLLPEEARPQGF
jgi:hypothetical protein